MLTSSTQLQNRQVISRCGKNENVYEMYKNEKCTCKAGKTKLGNFTLSFGRLRQRIVLKCVPHVQHDYFSSFNQSDNCFLASSLPLPSSLLELSVVIQKTAKEFSRMKNARARRAAIAGRAEYA